ncbi:MAG: PA2779 family protein [Pseudomonadota bacterium]|nr:hypothetical protein [Pseudomonadales bacterium]MDY6920918.1 PA2779 family protein [Pseudomonadota bacterium]
MSRFNGYQRALARLLAGVMVVVSIFGASAQAAVVSTQSLLDQEAETATRQQVMALLEREEARSALAQLGVAEADVQARIDAMSPTELQAFQQQLADMQAGGSALGVVVVVFVILILLDLLGTTNIFPAIKPINS